MPSIIPPSLTHARVAIGGLHDHSDHELVVCTFHFNIKAKRHHYQHHPSRQIKYLPRDAVSTFQTSLADAFDSYHTTPNSDANKVHVVFEDPSKQPSTMLV
jgi:hypothetical protein